MGSVNNWPTVHFRSLFVVLAQIHQSFCMWPWIPSGNKLIPPMFYPLLCTLFCDEKQQSCCRIIGFYRKWSTKQQLKHWCNISTGGGNNPMALFKNCRAQSSQCSDLCYDCLGEWGEIIQSWTEVADRGAFCILMSNFQFIHHSATGCKWGNVTPHLTLS